MWIRNLLFAVLAIGCAQGGSGVPVNGDDAPKQDATVKLDSSTSDASVTDASVPIDGMVPLDAFVPQDAASPFCTQNSNCTVLGECCITLGGPMGFCGPGVIIFDECFPQ